MHVDDYCIGIIKLITKVLIELLKILSISGGELHMEKIRMGVIGLGCRGTDLLDTIMACSEAEIVAVSDIYEERCIRAMEKVEKTSGKKPVSYANYKDMLADSNVDGVLIASSWEEHIRMAIESMKAGKITAMEVGCAFDVEECWELVRTYEETKTPFMMMENCCFDRFELLSTALVRAGKLGEIVHCHGAYSHDLRDEVLGGRVNGHYRLRNYQKRNCENYPTHELGPIAKLLGITRGNKILSVSSVASKSVGLKEYANRGNIPDKTLIGTDFAQGDIVSTTITCANGETITLTLDTTLPKYYSREFMVRGTRGLCNQEANMIFLEEKDPLHEFYEPHLTLEKYINNAKDYETEYLPDCWKNITEEERRLGHGGMDYIMFKEFFKAVMEGKELPVDVYDAATWLCVSALSEQSISCGGIPQYMPDFTRGQWMHRAQKDVIKLFNDE